jgi:hypothetical protein
MTALNPEDGKWYNVPGFNRDTGQRARSDDEALQNHIEAIRAGKVKAYNTAEEAAAAAREEHKELDGPAPSTKKGSDGLLKPKEFDDFTLDFDPMTHHLQGEDPANPEQEKQLAQVISGASGFVYGESMDKVIRNLKAQPELYLGASQTAFEILKKEKASLERGGRKADPAVFFAETGAVPLVLDMVWDVAKQVNVPGSDDPDQYAGAMINIMRLAGIQTAERGDEAEISAAEELATTMALTKEDGTMMEDPSVAQEANEINTKRTALADGIGQALLGGQG